MSAPSTSTTAFEALLQRLLASLRDERRLHDELLSLTTAERAAIVDPATLAAADGPLPLERIVADKEQALARLAELEESRMAASALLAAGLRLPRDARLADLIARLPAPVATALQTERQLLLDRMQTLAEANATNAALLSAALGATRATLGYMRAAGGSPYGPDGRSPAPAIMPHHLDRQA